MNNVKSGNDNLNATQQKNANETKIVTRMGGKSAPNNREARTSIPTYDRSSVKKVQTGMRGLKRN